MLNLRVFLNDCTVAIVTYCVGENTLNCSIMIGNMFHTIIEATNEKLWLY